jgi:hypothetical protein
MYPSNFCPNLQRVSRVTSVVTVHSRVDVMTVDRVITSRDNVNVPTATRDKAVHNCARSVGTVIRVHKRVTVP